jgi:hypothetical protein
LEKVAIFKLPVHPQLANSTFFGTFEKRGHHLADELERVSLLLFRFRSRAITIIVSVHALQAGEALLHEAVIDELSLRVKRSR